MINGETGYLSMDVKVPVDKGVSYAGCILVLGTGIHGGYRAKV